MAPCRFADIRVAVLYAVGIVELQLEHTSGLILLLFVIPLAFTLSGFLMWILYSLNGQYLLLKFLQFSPRSHNCRHHRPIARPQTAIQA
jgi:uncharacterized membrane protein YhfC